MRTYNKPVQFKDYQCSLEFGLYGNKRIALRLNDPETGQPIATASVNLPDAHLEPNEVFIKSWSENEGMAAALQDQGIIGPVKRTQPTGHVYATCHDLLVDTDQWPPREG